MKKTNNAVVNRKFNLLGLLSSLSFLLVIPLFLVPWYRLFLLRSNTLSTLAIHIVGLFVIGIVMLVLGLLAVVLYRKRKDEFKGNWMGIVGIILGAILAGFGGFFIVDYLIQTTV